MTKKIFLGTILFASTFGLWSFTQTDKFFEITRNIEIFSSLYKEVDTYYVDDVNPNDMIRKGIDAMLEELDPYTVYIPEDDIEDFRTNATGQYGGIGIQSNKINGKHLVLDLYQDSPAMSEGMKIGDEILAVDGQSIVELSDDDAGKLLKGQSGTSVNVEVLRKGKEKLDFDLERQRIKIPNISYQALLEDEIGYFRLNEFTKSAGEDVIKAVLELKSQGAKKMIIDLRGNPGGLLNQAVKICNLFVPKGSLIVETKAKTKASSFSYHAEEEPLDLKLPLAVLINGRSASASEIVSGVIQDYDRGIIIGGKSFGKGLVQVSRPLAFNSQLKVTTAKYYIPSGRCIQELDYVHKNADGTASTIADTLRKEFYTSNHRLVYEAGGIDPDIQIQEEKTPSFFKNLKSSGLIFEYATLYYYEHTEIVSPEEFQVTEAEYSDFEEWMESKTFENDSKVEQTIDILRKAAASDKAYKRLTDEIDGISSAIDGLKSKGLRTFQSEIKRELEKEIIKRYYYSSGVIKATLHHDPAVDSAKMVLNDLIKYNTLLNK